MVRYRQTQLGGCVAALVPALAALAQPGAPTAVSVDGVRLEPVQEHRRVTGELRAVRRSRVATHEEGMVVALPVREGQRVQAGEVLAELDSRRLELALEQAAADVLSFEGILDERKAEEAWRDRELELYQQSADRGAANVKEVLDAESAARIARARARQAQRQLEMARARVSLLEERLSDMQVKAPFEGVVVTRHTELGEWVAEGSPLLELVSVGEIEAWLDVPQRYFSAVSGRTVEVEIEVEASGRLIETDRIRVVPLVDPRARSFYVVATLDDEGGSLAPGMSLSVWVPTEGSAERLTVPKDAIMHNDAGAFVYVARGEQPAHAVPTKISPHFTIGARMVVDAPGLQPGDQVVVEGNERLFPMMPITPIPAGGGPPPGAEQAGGPR